MGQGRGKVEPGSGVPRASACRAGGSQYDSHSGFQEFGSDPAFACDSGWSLSRQIVSRGPLLLRILNRIELHGRFGMDTVCVEYRLTTGWGISTLVNECDRIRWDLRIEAGLEDLFRRNLRQRVAVHLSTTMPGGNTRCDCS